MYLAPLTYLFMSFFVQSYMKRSAADNKTRERRYSDLKVAAEKAGWDAAKDLEREVYGPSNEQAVVDGPAADVGGRENGRVLRSRS